MTNAELITTLRWCGSEDERHEMCVDETYRCPMWNEDRMTDYCKADIMLAAADVLEADEQRISELETQNELKDGIITAMATDIGKLRAQLPKEGEWEERYIEDANPMFRRRFYCSRCGEWTTHGKTRYCPNCGARMKKGEQE